MALLHNQNQKSYASDSTPVRAHFGTDLDVARSYFQPYVEFVLANLKIKEGRLLEVGCGSGWSTLMFKRAGVKVTGLDLYPGPPEAATVDPDLIYKQGDSQALPFDNESFDAIAMHDVLEHTPDPRKVLEESFRVLKRGGRLIIVGPNLLSVFTITYYTLKNCIDMVKKRKLVLRRKNDMPRHPGGNTPFEGFYYIFHHGYFTIKKLFFEKSLSYRMRIPDPNPPFFADNDACYYANPIDLRNWVNSRSDAHLVRWYSERRKLAKFLWPFLGGTWVVIEKL